MTRAQDWPWSSVRAHLSGEDDGLVIVRPLLDRVGDFRALLQPDARDEARFATLRRSETTGRPLAAEDFVRIWSGVSAVPSPSARLAANLASIRSCCDPPRGL